MNDYARGALEALAWILGMINNSAALKAIRQEIEGARDDILNGAAVDFRRRLRMR
jgi:hypothetical protein